MCSCIINIASQNMINQIKDMETSTPSHESQNIPEWFLIEILCKLPSKPLFRCKCVSIQFLTLISDPTFVRIYISRATKPRPWTLITREAHTVDSDHPSCEQAYDLERNLDSNSYESPTVSKLVTPKRLCTVVAVSNGLLFCRWELIPNSIVFNPITNQYIVLPKPHWIRQGGPIAFHAHLDQVGVVSYKLARLIMNSSVPHTDHLIEELSSDTNTWRYIATRFPEPVVFTNFFKWFIFKGIFHWFDDRSKDESPCIISYDPVRVIRTTGSGCIITCGEMVQTGGEPTIRCIKIDSESFIHVWRMKDYEQGTWQLEHNICIYEILLPCADNEMKPCTNMTTVAFHPSKQDFIYFWGKAEEEWMLVSYNVGSGESSVSDRIPRARGKITEMCKMFVVETPFVLPPWPAILPRSLLVK